MGGASLNKDGAHQPLIYYIGGSNPSSNIHKQKRLHKGGIFVYMARPEGFEPPTAWFVARYSIQLSYGRLKCLLVTGKW